LTQTPIGPATRVAGNPDVNALGLALHGFLGADRDGLSAGARIELAQRCLAGFGVSGALAAGAVVAAGDNLKAWGDRMFPKAKWRRELSVMHRRVDGSLVRGAADLVLQSPAGFVLVDHKSFGVTKVQEHCEEHVGQLEAYVEALEAAGLGKCLGIFVHLPVAGIVVGLEG